MFGRIHSLDFISFPSVEIKFLSPDYCFQAGRGADMQLIDLFLIGIIHIYIYIRFIRRFGIVCFAYYTMACNHAYALHCLNWLGEKEREDRARCFMISIGLILFNVYVCFRIFCPVSSET